MNFKELPTNFSKIEKNIECKHLLHSILPDISLPSQNGNLLKLTKVLVK